MSAIPPLALSSAISGTLRHVPLSSDHVPTRDPASQILQAQYGTLQEQLTAAQTHILPEKAAERRLRAEIAAFLGERGAIRSANYPVKAEDDVTLPEASQPMDTSAEMYDADIDRYLEESPLVLRLKRKLAQVRSSAEDSPLKRRGFAMVPR
ncbi:hypothetical protein C8T65DRAFT_740689 [Cerioporus squamosus]|nr:hypothetical protein C8T65DRAFT_740689 [Cerioporus squamosus]